MGKVSKRVGEKDPTEKAHSIFKPGTKLSGLTIAAFVVKETRYESNQ